MNIEAINKDLATMQRLIKRAQKDHAIGENLAKRLIELLANVTAAVPTIQQAESEQSVPVAPNEQAKVPSPDTPIFLPNHAAAQKIILQHLQRIAVPAHVSTIAVATQLPESAVKEVLRELRAQHLVTAMARPEGGVQYSVKTPE